MYDSSSVAILQAKVSKGEKEKKGRERKERGEKFLSQTDKREGGVEDERKTGDTNSRKYALVKNFVHGMTETQS